MKVFAKTPGLYQVPKLGNAATTTTTTTTTTTRIGVERSKLDNQIHTLFWQAFGDIKPPSSGL